MTHPATEHGNPFLICWEQQGKNKRETEVSRSVQSAGIRVPRCNWERERESWTKTKGIEPPLTLWQLLLLLPYKTRKNPKTVAVCACNERDQSWEKRRSSEWVSLSASHAHWAWWWWEQCCGGGGGKIQQQLECKKRLNFLVAAHRFETHAQATTVSPGASTAEFSLC